MKTPQTAVAVALLLCVFGLWWWFSVPSVPSDYAEARTIGAGVRDFKELSLRFTQLAQKRGGVYAFEVLKRAELPPNTDLHLLGHVVGDELYKEKGVEGIADCTQDFRNACSHSVVIGALTELGSEDPAIVETIREACSKAPGGSGAYTMCFHGLGHGVFAYFDYSLPKTISFCKRTGTAEYHDREYMECAGGAVMELMGGGAHDREKWLAARRMYLTDDPLSPCMDAVVPADAKEVCLMYISPRLFEVAGADLAAPKPEHFAKAFTYCDDIPSSEGPLRQSCFAGIGKEFPVLALARDIRAVSEASDENLRHMREWCSLAPHLEAYGACARSVLDSLFWGGENDSRVSLRFCELAPPEEVNDCFNYIFGLALNYLPHGPSLVSQFCSRLSGEPAALCERRLSP